MCNRRRLARRTAFTLIELMVVVAIIAILISLLIPSLARAREQAKIVKCTANIKAITLGVMIFTEDHQGYGQLMAIGDAWRQIDSARRRYAYEGADGSMTASQLRVSPWPVAYGPYIGAKGLTTQNYFDTSPPGTGGGTRRRGGGDSPPTPGPTRKSKVSVLRCPSDLLPVSNVGYPATLYGVLSYSINLDLFGTSIGRQRTWREGRARSGDRLEGNLQRIVRPSEVVMFVDGGNDPVESDEPQVIMADNDNGAWLPEYAFQHHGLPVNRHSKKGGLSAGFADGHATYLRAVEWFDHSGTQQKFVQRFSPHPRISPYDPFDRSAGGSRRR